VRAEKAEVPRLLWVGLSLLRRAGAGAHVRRARIEARAARADGRNLVLARAVSRVFVGQFPVQPCSV